MSKPLLLAWLLGSVVTAVPTSSSFVEVTSTGRLTLDGKPFRFGGANLYWLGLDENVKGADQYPLRGAQFESALTNGNFSLIVRSASPDAIT